MATRVWGNEYRTITVCIDSYEEGILAGRLYNPYWEAGKEFRSMSQFLSVIEQILDTMDFPRSFTITRSFINTSRWKTGPPEAKCRSGNLATFAIKILFRQNASWQGSICWIEGEREQSFRSALEMIFLMDSVLVDAESIAG